MEGGISTLRIQELMLACLSVSVTISYASYASDVLFFYQNDLFLFMCTCLSLFVCPMYVIVSQRSRKNIEPSEARVTGGCEQSCGCWESSPGLLQEQPVLSSVDAWNQTPSPPLKQLALLATAVSLQGLGRCYAKVNYLWSSLGHFPGKLKNHWAIR